MSSSPGSKISIYSLSDLKTTLDDHIPIFLSSSSTPSAAPLPRNLRFTPSQSHTYIRLGLGYSAVAIALYIFYLDYIVKVEFRDIKALTAWSVVVYFVLNCALQGWIWFGEKGIVFVGERKMQLITPGTLDEPDGHKKRSAARLEIYSLAPHQKYDPTYRLSINWYDASVTLSGSLGKATKEGPMAAKEVSLATIEAVKEGTANDQGRIELEAPFTHFFTQEGHFVAAAFESWLRREIPLIDGTGLPTSVAAPTPTQTSVKDSITSPSRINKSGSGDEDEDLIMVDTPASAAMMATAASPPSFSSGISQKKSSKRRA